MHITGVRNADTNGSNAKFYIYAFQDNVASEGKLYLAIKFLKCIFIQKCYKL